MTFWCDFELQCHCRFEKFLVAKGFAERCAEHEVKLMGPKGKWRIGKCSLRLLPGAAERIINADETNISIGQSQTRRKHYPGMKRAPHSRPKARSSNHTTLNAAMSMPDWINGTEPKLLPMQVRLTWRHCFALKCCDCSFRQSRDSVSCFS